MKHTGLVITTIVALSLLISIPVLAVGAHNINLTAVTSAGAAGTGTSSAAGVTGMATSIVGDVGGPTPFHMVEINARVNQAPPANMVYEGWLVDSKNNYKLSLGVFKGMQLNSVQRLIHFEDVARVPYDSIAVSMEQAHDTNPLPGTIVAQGNLPGDMLTAANFVSMAVLPEDAMFQREILKQRFALTDAQITDLRMMGLQFDQIALIGNTAITCKRAPSAVASMVMQGMTWEQIASNCNTTVAALMAPVPMSQVASYQAELGTMTTPGTVGAGMGTTGTVVPLMYYGMYPNGTPVLTFNQWQSYYMRGYDWRNVAVAANISMMTGESIDNLLRMTRIEGMTWRQIATDRGLDFSRVTDVSRWPFGTTDQMPSQMMPIQPGVMTPSTTTPGTMAPSTTTTPGTMTPETGTTTPDSGSSTY